MDLTTKIIDLVKEKELKVEDYEERVKICGEISNLLVEAGYTNCLVYPYGSTINSVGFTDSDLDLYLDLGTSCSVSDISKILEKSSVFSSVEAVPHARVPIVKATHSLSAIKCDISFGDKANLWNTEFIRFCCLSDPRVRPLIMVVRYWAYRHNIVGREGQVKMCNYALTLMVIAYLQQLPHPVLHSVQELIPVIDTKTVPSSFSTFLEARKELLSPQLNNTDSIPDLLLGFFSHYLGYDYMYQGVSVFLGRSWDRKFAGYGGNQNIFKSNNPICVQDPFERDYNVCRNITATGLSVWKHCLQDAVQKMLRLKSEPSSGYLEQLFHPSPHGCWDTKYYTSMQDYQAAAIRHTLLQRMPPCWRRWRRLS